MYTLHHITDVSDHQGSNDDVDEISKLTVLFCTLVHCT